MSKSDHDKKGFNRPPSWFKKQRRQQERARVNQAIREEVVEEDGPDTLTRKRDDKWDWN